VPKATAVLRVGVDAWNLPYDRRGVGRFVREILRCWHKEFGDRIEPVLVLPEWHTWTAARRYRSAVPWCRYDVVSRRFHQRAGLDLIWLPWNGPSWEPLLRPAVACIYDDSPFVFPDRTNEREPMLRAVRLCDHIVTISHASRVRLQSALGVAAEQISVVYPGVAPALRGTAAEPIERDRFILFVGSNERRKGIDVLLAAMKRVWSTGEEIRLVLAGEGHERPLVPSDRIESLGRVDDGTLAALYRACAVFVLPSLHEGFGIPVLEAMACGAPVVCSDAGGLLEAAGDAALVVPSGDADALAAAILRVLRDEHTASDLRTRGMRRAADFTWRSSAEQMLDVFEHLVRSHRS
jgi:glycosyltransferase involved in cell wall biosynthesis